ncbi:hypothetical protein [Nonomuraea sp. NPDC049309]|uniref:hypothetical protein n=1 Tax=Nonomuraea sp. NPDC049309 TaxID=3364350 RepID=UPI00370FC96A
MKTVPRTSPGEVTVRGVPGRRARCTEVMIRSLALIGLPTTVFAAFRESTYWLWPWTCTVGAPAAALCSPLVYSTTPEESRRCARGYGQRWRSMLLYAVVIAIIGAGVQVGTLKDVGSYVFILMRVTIGVHCCAKCAVAGPAVRGNVARAFSVGRRVALLGR